MAKQSPQVTLDPNSPVFQTPDGAAAAVSKMFANLPGEQSAACILRPDGTYGYSTISPQQEESHFEMRVALPKDHKLACVIHSHPGNDQDGQYFSSDDIDVANKLNVPSFIRFNRDDSIRRYTPGQTKTTSIPMSGHPFGVKAAVGDQIAQEPVQVVASPGIVDSPVVVRDNSPIQYPST
jgi:hypothetical protein